MSYIVGRISYVVLRIARCVSRVGHCAPVARCEGGVVLVGVLWLKIILLAIVAISAQNSRLDFKVRVLGTEELRCRWACRAGIEKAIGILNEDPRECDDLTELWSDNDEDFNDVILVGCHFAVRLIDEASKLNINTATKEQLLELPNMIEDIVDAIIDWRDDNDSVSGLGVEGEYYETLTYPYTIRNGPFKTIRELLLVRGVTEELLYGEDTNFNGQLDHNENDGEQTPPNDDANGELDLGWIEYLSCYSYDNGEVDAAGEARININQGNQSSLESSLGIKSSHARWIVDNRTHDSIADLINNNSPKEPQSGNSNNAQPLDLQTFGSIADMITVGGGSAEGKINLNTASEYVLSALLGGGDSGMQLAEQVISFREEQLYGMESIAEILEAGGMSVDMFKKIADLVTVRSDVYTIRCSATGDRASGNGLTLWTETVVDRSSTPYETLYWYQGANN